MNRTISDPFSELEARYSELLSWCDLSKAIADFLPCHANERLCGTVAEGRLCLASEYHRPEEQIASDCLGAIMDGGERSVDLHLASALSLQCLQTADCLRPRCRPGASQRRSGKP